MKLTDNQLVDLVIGFTKDLKAVEGDDSTTEEEDRADLLEGLKEDPAVGIVMHRLADAIWQMGYDAAVATKFPVFGTAQRTSLTGDGQYQLVYHFANLDQLSRAEQEWRSFIQG